MPKQSPKIVIRRVSELKPYKGNARTHSKRQIRQIADSIGRFGFNNPILVGSDDEVIAGHGRLAAASLLGMSQVPTLELAHLTGEARRAYILADNKLAANAGWDSELLAIELGALLDLDFDVSLTGFSIPDVDMILHDAEEATEIVPVSAADEMPGAGAVQVSRLGDLWQLGPHRLLCGDAREPTGYKTLLAGEEAGIMFTDPPYNVKIPGNVSGLGRKRHANFVMASGEMSSEEFTSFLISSLGIAAEHCRDGGIAFVFIDWRHIGELLNAGRVAFDELKNVCVWNKTNGGMGTFYRSKHELIFVFKKGKASHINNFGLGENGRYRTNVWDYAGMSSMSNSRAEELNMHATVKPVALIVDALRDCSKRGDIVLDPFAGSGSTLIAAHKCGRVARVIELDPSLCDTIIRRFTKLTGKQAILASTQERFDEIEDRLLNGETR